MSRTRLTFLLFFLASSLAAQSQTERGTWLLGGGASFISVNGDNTTTLNPNIGYFVSPKVAVGSELLLVLVSQGGATWFAGPFVKPYFLSYKTGSFFSKGALLIRGVNKSKPEWGYGVSAGYAAFLNKSVALEFAPGINKSSKDADMVFLMSLGFQIHFKK